jgi:hypothetical protein
MAQVKLLGPDLAMPVIVPVETTMTVLNLKERVLMMWPSGLCLHLFLSVGLLFEQCSYHTR